MLGHQDDFWEPLRGTVLPFVGHVLTRLGDHVGGDLYAESTTGRSQFVFLVDKHRERVERDLDAIGFERNPLAAWKTLAGTEHTEVGSWRWYDDGETIVEPTAAHEQFIQTHGTGQADTQTHVVLYEIDGDESTTAVFAHHEAAWHIHPIIHYRGRFTDAVLGVNNTRALFREHYGEDYCTLVSESTGVLPG